MEVDVPTLLAMDFRSASAFYRDVAQVGDVEDLRWLCRQDRYFLLTAILARRDAIHPWLYDRCREVQLEPEGWLDLWSRFHYKAVSLDYPVPTPSGWRKHGDLAPGDLVFGSDGRPVRVVARTPVFTDAKCYRVQTDDGHEVVVSAEHLWTVAVCSKARTGCGNRRKGWKTVTISTEELAHEVERSVFSSSRPLPFIRGAGPAHYSCEDFLLPLHPYVLGVWLGDGSRGGPRVTAGLDDADAMQNALQSTGVSVSRIKHSGSVTLRLGNGVCGRKGSSEVSNAIRSLGVYKAKRIPAVYMMASVEDRFALLQGLMDTDGASKEDGQCIFCQALEPLAIDVFDLCLSLGYKATIFKRYGLYCGEKRAYWQVQIRGTRERPPFRLLRKADRLPDEMMGVRHRVTSVYEVPSVPVSCIQVDAGDGLYCIGRNYLPTHNSTIITMAGAVQEILINPEVTSGIFSNVLSLSKKFVKQIQRALESRALVQLFPDILYDRPPQRNWSAQEGLIVRRKSNPKEPTVQAAGLVDGQPVGAHYSLRIYDDIVTPDSVSTPEQIAKTTEAWELSLALGTAEGGRAWYCGTRYHPDDTYSALLERKVLKERRRICYGMDGKSVLMPDEKLAQLRREMGERTFASQMLQNPISAGTRTFRDEWFHTLEKMPDRSTLNVYLLIDSANAKKKISDYTCMIVFGMGRDENYYVLDAVRDRLNLAERARCLFDLVERWKPNLVFWEQVGLASDVQHIHLEQERVGWHFPILEIPQSVAKNDRIKWLIPVSEQGRLWFPNRILKQSALGETYDWVHDFQHFEFASHPVCRHDDMLDCLANIRHPSVLANARFPMAPREEGRQAPARTVNKWKPF